MGGGVKRGVSLGALDRKFKRAVCLIQGWSCRDFLGAGPYYVGGLFGTVCSPVRGLLWPPGRFSCPIWFWRGPKLHKWLEQAIQGTFGKILLGGVRVPKGSKNGAYGWEGLCVYLAVSGVFEKCNQEGPEQTAVQ